MSTDLEERNAKAVMAALKEQNAKIAAFQTSLSGLANTVGILNQKLEDLRKQNVNDLIARLGTGPTVIDGD